MVLSSYRRLRFAAALGAILCAASASAQQVPAPPPSTPQGQGDAKAAPSSPAFSLQTISDLLTKPPPAPPQAATAPPAASVPGDAQAQQSATPVPPPATLSAAAPAAGAAVVARAPLTLEQINTAPYARVDETSRTVSAVVLKAEVLLDRAHAPPGVIDGRNGSNFTKAIRTFEEVHGLEVDGKLSRRVWDELGGDTAAAVFGPYTIKPEDVVGPFYPNLSADYAEQAKLPDLGYRSAEEMFGERFHMDKKFLRAMNPGIDMAVAGNTILVAAVDTMPIATPIARIDVDKGAGQVLAYDGDGLLVVAYPATIGSDELPSPSGSYVVRGVAPHPTYTYDPQKNFQQGNNVKKLILPPGPNNPVGAAFIALSKPTYGIHGTPDPSKIDKTRSHGCVRLTNWNAKELAALVTPGTPVNFLDKPGAPELGPDVANVSPDPIGALAAPGR